MAFEGSGQAASAMAITVPPIENSWGMRYSRASVMAMPSRMVPKMAPWRASRLIPSRQTMNAQMPAVASSMRGYWAEMGWLQPRQRARSRIHEITGMLSYQASIWPQRGQRERGWTTDCFGSTPQRRMQTLRKLPIMAPTTAARTISKPTGSSSLTHDSVQQDAGGDRHVE
jgi:hypothetical protein